MKKIIIENNIKNKIRIIEYILDVDGVHTGKFTGP
jgi:hypothetical protein